MSYKYGQCVAVTKAGDRCPTGSMMDSVYCHVHCKVGKHRVGVALVSRNGKLNEIAYREYLFSDRWRQKKAKRLEVDNYCCVLCNTRESLECHHVVYSRLGFEMLSDLRTLCHSCHAEVTADERLRGRDAANARFKTSRSRANRRKRAEALSAP